MLYDPKWEKQTSTDLIAARQLIQRPEQWSRNAASGTLCPMMAIWSACGSYDETDRIVAAKAALYHAAIPWWRRWLRDPQKYGVAIVGWNYRATHQKVLAAFDRAIAAA